MEYVYAVLGSQRNGSTWFQFGMFGVTYNRRYQTVTRVILLTQRPTTLYTLLAEV